MKVFRGAALASIVVFGLGFAILPTPTRIFWGEITDSLCAQVGSHQTKSKSLQTARECTIGCVEAGAQYVLYNARSHRIYRLDDQGKPRQFAGERVVVLGTWDANTNSIHVMEIQSTYVDTLWSRGFMLLTQLRRGH